MATIVKGAQSVTPEHVLGYEASRQTGTIVHQIIGKSSPDVSTTAAQLRVGTLVMLFEDTANAWECFNLAASAGPLTLTVPELPSAGMLYVPRDTLQIQLDPETAAAWILSVPFQEVGP